ncbi:MAG TPA: hypothetical protein VGO00_11395 [Kofleriaceae bacterium]|jgi:hypothetical protein|nr:hypothetical protein [Kofleriaceae bacterium]
MIPFPFQDTLANLDYRITEHLRGTGDERVYLGTRAHHPDNRYLISVSAQGDMPIDKLRRSALGKVAGVFDVDWIGHFDTLGVDPLRDAERLAHYAMIEKLPDGDQLARVAGTKLEPDVAIFVGAAVARIALDAARAGVIIAGLRPDFVWVRRDGDALEVTGIGSRNRDFFACARPRSMVTHPLFELRQPAPELAAFDEPTEQTLVFVIAAMIAEWVTGTAPFADRNTLRAAQPRPLDLPAALGALIARAFDVEPARRPTLPAFIDALAAT